MRGEPKLVMRFKRPRLVAGSVSRRIELDTSRVNQRKYYGIKTEIGEMEETLEYHVNHTAAINELRDSLVTPNGDVSEDFATDVLSRVNFLRDGKDETVDDLQGPVENSFEKGTRRAFTSSGERLPAAEVAPAVTSLLQQAENSVSKLTSDMRRKAEQVIRSGLDSGLSESRIVENLREALKQLVGNRKSVVADGLAAGAAVKGMENTFDENDVTEVVWVASQDNDVCEPGTFTTAYNGETFTSCRELHGEQFTRTGNYPRPLQDTHPHCRCVVTALDE